MSESEHKEKEITIKIKADEGIARSVALINLLGFIPLYSCEGNDEKEETPYVYFHVSEYNGEETRQKITQLAKLVNSLDLGNMYIHGSNFTIHLHNKNKIPVFEEILKYTLKSNSSSICDCCVKKLEQKEKTE